MSKPDIRSVIIVGAFIALPAVAARADQYDGKWAIDFPASEIYATNNSGHGCAAIRVVVAIKDSRISGTLSREPTNPTEVSNGSGSGASPLTGTVAPDGSVTATWQRYAVTGKLAGSSGQVNVTGECGPRTGTAQRVQE